MKVVKPKLTNRKFYNKWLYKVSLNVKGSAVFRDRTLDDVINFCKGGKPDHHPYSVFHKAYNNKSEILELCEMLSQVDASIWSKRVENDSIDFYTNDANFYNQIASTFNKLVIHQFEPSAGTSDVLNTGEFFISGNKLPHNQYNYRVYLLPHKLSNDIEEKTKFLNWMDTQGDKIRCSVKVRDWFLHTRWNWDRRYILVEDDSTLLMLKLRNSEAVGRVYKYVISDK